MLNRNSFARAIGSADVSRETEADLEQYVALLMQWQKKINLIGPSTKGEVWQRHILDSLQLLGHAPTANHWLDLGSGAGFPGLVLAIALKQRENAFVIMVESNSKKAAFLSAVTRALSLPAKVYSERIETVLANQETCKNVEIITARALASLTDLCTLAYPLLKTGIPALFLKGKDVKQEIETARQDWEFEEKLTPSLTKTEAQILHLSQLRQKLK